MTPRILPSLLTCLALLAACGGSDSAGPPASYLQARQQWRAAAITNYHYTYSRSCFCVPESPIEVVVRNGTVAGAHYTDTGASVGPQRLATLPTLTGFFDEADAAYAGRAAAVTFTVNRTNGYLETLFIDRSSMIADEEVGYTISNFAIDGS